jgi:hypothetical protein
MVGRNSAVGICTSYGLESPEIESRWGQDFLYQSRSTIEPTQLPVQWVLGPISGGTAVATWH